MNLRATKFFHLLDLSTMKTKLVEAGPEMLAAFRENVHHVGRKTCILIVEDEPNDSEWIAHCFEPHSAMANLIFATTVDEANKVLSAGGIDVVLLDLSLSPQGGRAAHGLDVIRYAQKNDKSKDTRFIVITSTFSPGSPEVEAATDLPEVLYAIKKPLRPEQAASISRM